MYSSASTAAKQASLFGNGMRAELKADPYAVLLGGKSWAILFMCEH